MKRKVINLFTFVWVLMLLSACQSDKVKSGTYKYNETYQLTDKESEGVLTLKMRMKIPEEYRDSEVLRKVRNDLVSKTLGSNHTTCSNDECLRILAEELKTEYRDNNLPYISAKNEESMSMNNDFILNASDVFNDGHIYSYEVDMYVFTGGAHGLNTLQYTNYNMSDGTVLTENDIFKSDSEEQLTEVLKKGVAAYDTSIHSVAELDSVYWVEAIVPNGNFYLSNQGITYVYNPYDIAPYVYGHTKVELLFEDIQDILKQDSPVSYLFAKKK